MNPNINYYGIVILLRKLRECGIFTEKELRKIAARIAADSGVEGVFFLWFSSSFSSYLDAVVVCICVTVQTARENAGQESRRLRPTCACPAPRSNELWRIWSSMDTCKRSHATVTMGAAHPTCIPCSMAVKKAQSSAKGGLRPFDGPRGGSWWTPQKDSLYRRFNTEKETSVTSRIALKPSMICKL